MCEQAFNDALHKFHRRIDDSRNLVEIHKGLGKTQANGDTDDTPRRGRRYRGLALNRAVVVLTVAAWQAYVEDLLEAALTALNPPTSDGSLPSYKVMKSTAPNVRHNFSTPNAENTRNLLMTLGYDPWLAWAWSQTNGSTQLAQTVMNQWLKVRHAIAHGDSPPDVNVLTTTQAGNKSLRRANAEECIDFFVAIVAQTNGPAISHFTT